MSIPTGGLVLKWVHVRAFDSDMQNEDIGIDDAIEYTNTTLLPRAGEIALTDILEIHRRVLRLNKPRWAGSLRTIQVWVARPSGGGGTLSTTPSGC